MWSPIAVWNLDATAYSVHDFSETGKWRFLVAYPLIFLSILCGYVMGSKFITIPRIDFPRQQNKLIDQKISGFILAASILVILFYAAEPGNRSQTIDSLRYLKGTSLISYHTLRRETSYGGIFGMYYPRFQFSLIFLLFSATLWRGVTTKKPYYFLIALLLFTLGGLSLRKMSFFFYFCTTSAIFYLNYRHKITKKVILTFAPAAAACIALVIYGLFLLQYRDLQRLDNSRIQEIFLYRTFAAYPSGFKLYLDFFPEIYGFTYGRTMPGFSHIFGHYGIQPYTLIPQYYGFNNTSAPAGYAAYAYSDFSFFGIILYSLIVGNLAYFMNRFSKYVLFRFSSFGPVFAFCIAISWVWIWTKPINIVLLSGGVGLIPIIVFILGKAANIESFPSLSRHHAPLKT
jgi:oligosaccharide repeat unit polymerase